MSKALYFRVGMDTGVGGCVAPIFHGGTFEYIPIPSLITTESCTYNTCKGRHGNYLSKYLPTKLHILKIHYDPDFRGEIPVYGDDTSHQKKIQSLNEDDLLVFYAGLSPWGKNSKSNIDLYFIGYFVVDEWIITNMQNVQDQPPNAHSKGFEYVAQLGDDIIKEYRLSLEELRDFYHPNHVAHSANVAKGFERMLSLCGYSGIKNIDKSIKYIMSNRSLWKYFIQNNPKDIIIDTYMHLLHEFSEFTLVKGKAESRLFKTALKISKRGRNRAEQLENVVSDEWAEILGIPPELSLQRKNPRFVPNTRYSNKGDFNLLKNFLFNHL